MMRRNNRQFLSAGKGTPWSVLRRKNEKRMLARTKKPNVIIWIASPTKMTFFPVVNLLAVLAPASIEPPMIWTKKEKTSQPTKTGVMYLLGSQRCLAVWNLGGTTQSTIRPKAWYCSSVLASVRVGGDINKAGQGKPGCHPEIQSDGETSFEETGLLTQAAAMTAGATRMKTVWMMNVVLSSRLFMEIARAT